MIDFILEGIARSAIALALSAVFAWLLLAVLRPRSPRVHQVVWFLVILQAACWQPIGLAILAPPATIETTASIESSIEQPLATIFTEPPTPLPIEPPTVAAEPSQVVPFEPAVVAPPNWEWSWKPIVFSVWVLGGLVLLLVGLVDYFRLHQRLVREASPIPSVWIVDWQSLPNRGCELVTTKTFGPLAIRTVRRAVVAVPREFGDSLASEQRRAVFSHELNHLRSGDPFWMLLVWLATSVQWFNPFAWLSSRRFHAAAELACDDRLDESSRLPLAEVLLQLGQPTSRTALAMSGGTLATRIRALASPKTPETHWKAALAALFIIAGLSVGWIRLEAKQLPKQERKPSGDVAKKEQTASRLKAEIELQVDEFQREFQKKSAEYDKLKQGDRPPVFFESQIGKKKKFSPEGSNVRHVPFPKMIRDAEERLKRFEVEKKDARSAFVKSAKDREKLVSDLKSLESKGKLPPEASAQVDEWTKRVNDAQLVFQQKSAEYDRLKRDLEAMRDDFESSRTKLERLWIRALRQTNTQDDDAFALDKALSYLAAREPHFGVAEILPYEEHVETEAVLKLEALLNRNIKPQPNETYRRALERILQTPSDARKRLAEMRAKLKEVQSELPNWEDRRDYWLNLAADLFSSAATREFQEVWSLRPDAKTKKEVWTARYFHWAAVRQTRADNSLVLLSLQAAHPTAGAHDADRAMLLHHILVVETICIVNAHDDQAWQILTDDFTKTPPWPKSKDPRQGDLVWTRMHAMLDAASNSTHRERGRQLRTVIAQDSPARIPAAGIDKLMELEGVAPNERVQFFLNRQVSVNFQGRAFANAFAELRSIAAVPLVVLTTGWESNLRPITLSAEAKWTDVVREVCRQANLPMQSGNRLTIIGDYSFTIGEVKVGQPVQSASKRLLEAHQGTRTAPGNWRQKLERPTFLKLSETPASQALRFLTTQSEVPILLLPNREIDQNGPLTVDVDRAPLAVALEAMCLSIRCVWIPVGDSIIVVPERRKAEMEAKAAEFREQLKRLKESAAKGDAGAKTLIRPHGIGFHNTPLAKAVATLERDFAAPGLSVRINDDKKQRITFEVINASVVEILAIFAWTYDLKLTFEGNKAVLSAG